MTKKEMREQSVRIRRSQPKDNCYIEVGEYVRIEINDETFEGYILEFGMRLQTNTEHDGLHPFLSLGKHPNVIANDFDEIVMLWIENIDKLTVIEFA